MGRAERWIFIVLAMGLGLLSLAVGVWPRIFVPSVKVVDPFPKDRVPTVRIVMPTTSWHRIMANPMAEQYVRADFWFEGQRYPNVAVRPKGNSSLVAAAGSGTQRLSFKVDFNMLNRAQTFCGIRKLNLNNGWSDPTFIREVLGYEIFEQMGIPVPRAGFVDLWINDIHLGLYTQVEQIDKTFLSRHFKNPNGNLYKPEWAAAGLSWTNQDVQEADPDGLSEAKLLQINLGGSRLAELLALLESETKQDTALPQPQTPPIPAGPRMPPGPQFGTIRPGPVFGPGMPAGPDFRARGRFGQGPFGIGLVEAAGLKTNENIADHKALFRFLDVLNHTSDKEFPDQIQKILDVDLWLRYLAVSVAIVHLDNYIGMGHNYYLYESEGRFTVLAWDLNMAFGTFNMGSPTIDPAEYPIDQPMILTGRPLASRILAHKPFMDRYHMYLRQVVNECLAPGVIEARIDQLSQLVRPYIPKDQIEAFERGIDQGSGLNTMAGAWPFGQPGPAPGRPPADLNRPIPGFGPGPFGPDPNMPLPPGMGPRGGRPWMPGGPPGMNAPGLKAFVQRRRDSIQRQLSGEAPTKIEQGFMPGLPFPVGPRPL